MKVSVRYEFSRFRILKSGMEYILEERGEDALGDPRWNAVHLDPVKYALVKEILNLSRHDKDRKCKCE